MEKKAFSFMKMAHRNLKPRETGITMMVDWGIGPVRQKDILDISGPFVDIAKVAVGLSGVMAENVLEQKIAIYDDFQVQPFIGGQFLEYGIFFQGMEIAKPYFAEVKRIGYKIVEVSDNNLEISLEDKFKLIRIAREEFGLKVLGEVGSKKDVTLVEEMVVDIRNCLKAGAWKVFVEGAEFTSKTDGSLLTNVIEGIMNEVDSKDIIFELPGRWISNVHGCGIHDMEVFLVEHFGPEVNIANVAPDEILELETLRTGVGVKMGLPKKWMVR